MRKIISGFIFIIFFASCNFSGNVSFSDEEQEKANAETVAAQYFMAVSRSDYASALPLFSDDFFKFTNKKETIALFEKTAIALGKFETYKLADWKTLRVKGTNAKTEYLLVYDVKYSNFDAQEIFSMVKEGEEIKIFSYRIISDGFRYEIK